LARTTNTNKGTRMQRFMLKSKIHRATVTGLALDYEGSITLDRGLLERADILPGEQVHILNVNNGERFITYAIPARRGSGTVELNGPAARLCAVGDKIIIVTFSVADDSEARAARPRVLWVDGRNRPLRR